MYTHKGAFLFHVITPKQEGQTVSLQAQPPMVSTPHRGKPCKGSHRQQQQQQQRHIQCMVICMLAGIFIGHDIYGWLHQLSCSCSCVSLLHFVLLAAYCVRQRTANGLSLCFVICDAAAAAPGEQQVPPHTNHHLVPKPRSR